ncbi:hypothetical protein BHE74_00023601 [Ensete ventricosum]|nr:hypothetical protein BHE74_00023601 [Ensete ventricosum]RZR99972.1 hypothetical protein BHM03_00029598 [Ensete ventricosum]
MCARLWNNCLPTKAMHMGKVPTGKPLVARGGTGWWSSTHRALSEATPALGSSRLWARNPQARCPCEATSCACGVVDCDKGSIATSNCLHEAVGHLRKGRACCKGRRSPT